MNRYMAVVASLAVPVLAQAAEPGTTPADIPDLYALKTPDSPAFVALGVSPTEIQRPTSPSAFATSLVSAFQSSSSGLNIPQGFAMEVAPFWLVSHPTLTFKDYANSGVESSWYRNATLSFATSGQAKAVSDDAAAMEGVVAAGTNVAFGIRTTIVHPKLSAAQASCAMMISAILGGSADQFSEQANVEATKRANDAWRAAHGEVPNEPSGPPPVVEKPVPPGIEGDGADPAARLKATELKLGQYRTDLLEYEQYSSAKSNYEAQVKAVDEYKRFISETRSKLINDVKAEMLEAFNKERAVERDAAIEPCLEQINARGDGVSLDAAFASVWNYSDSRFESGEFLRSQAWTTLAYATGGVSLLALGRWTREKTVAILPADAEVNHSFDFGARAIYADDRWGLSFEFLQRSLDGSPRRFAGGFDYRMAEGTWVTGTFGKNTGVGNEGAVLALLGVQLNVGEQRLAETPASAK